MRQKKWDLKEFKVVAITHRTAQLDQVGNFHLETDKQAEVLKDLKAAMNWDELMYLSTCNRVEFIIVSETPLDVNKLTQFFKTSESVFNQISEVYEGVDAVDHVFRVASSLDSMVIGEREIITQVRNAYESSRDLGLTGDTIRLLVRKTIENAKRIYTETGISHKPISVVSLGYRMLNEFGISPDSKVLLIGAGQTNTAMARFLSKKGLEHAYVYNRTLENAEKLAETINGKARSLENLTNHSEGFDIIITCTGADQPILTPEVYTKLLNGDTQRKMIIDLAVPLDTHEDILHQNNVEFLSVEKLRPIAERNLQERSGEIENCETILNESLTEFDMMYNERKVERAMGRLPEQVKELKNHALNNVFANDLDKLDSDAREVLEKVMTYMEKKYISGPMKMAKEIILDKKHVK